MNLEHIVRGVAQHLRDGLERRISAERTVCLDDSQGPRRGCLLLLFDGEAPYPRLVAKAAPRSRARKREGKPLYDVEYDNLVLLEQSGLNAEERCTPQPIARWQDGDLLVTVQSAFAGELMKNVPGRRLFSAANLEGTVDRVLGWWERFLRACPPRPTRVTDDVYRERVLQTVERFRERFELADDERAFLTRRFSEERRLADRELPLLVRHGDFCPANIVLPPAAGPAVFDWEFPLRPELPLFDLFHFFAALRWPFRGWRGESSHFASFVEVYWGSSPMSRVVAARLRDVARRHEIPPSALGDLFVLALLEIANLKFEALLEIHGRDPVAPGPGSSAWREAGGVAKDVPFACIRDGVLQNLRVVVRRGLPPFLQDGIES